MASIGADTAPDIEIERLTSLSRAMLRRLSQVETAMKRSEAESDELRARLARARLDAELDHLTQLPNRRAFEREFRGAVEESAARGTRLSVGFCDVDHFKAINDTHGHDAGDRVLIAIARSLERHLGDNCFAARHGGEEFAVLFRGLGLQEARQHLDAVRAAQSARRMINRETGNGFGKITFSAGIAEVAGPDDARDALARADRALYQAKDGGRDRIAIL
jgi:diguanylate cyclase